MNTFALIGAAGYIAPRHMQAINSTGNIIVAATDPNDSVGILDKYSYNIAYFKEFERFDRHLEKMAKSGQHIDYITVCSPNYLHDAHIRFGLRIGADVICEKPLVLNPWNCDALIEDEKESKNKINTILQLRLHPSIIALKEKYKNTRNHKISLKYITPRGPWYQYSWKGNIEQSGGLLTNIGIHFFDMLLWVFGPVQEYTVSSCTTSQVVGTLELDTGTHVDWFLSINNDDIPPNHNKSTYRSIIIDDEELEFSDGFTDLHILSYKEILAGNGFSIQDAKPSIQLVHDIRETTKYYLR